LPRAILLNKTNEGVSSSLVDLPRDSLPENEVTVAVEYSTVNYKDGLVLNGLGNLVKTYPHVPGIDFAGTVTSSRSPRFKIGEKVILTGWRVGELHWGGFAEEVSVKADWLVHLPTQLTTRDAMVFGTAGLTAMLSVLELEAGGTLPENGPVLVTGATGGVGSVAVALLAERGYTVAASTGKSNSYDELKALGAASIHDRAELSASSNRPLEAEKWNGCIDSVGGQPLARVLSQVKYGGTVAAVGLVAGSRLDTTVIPFLLRGVRLIGVDSVMSPEHRRRTVWQNLAKSRVIDRLRAFITEVGLEDVPEVAKKILEGNIKGRTVVAIAR
jgi:acrylyl-CoA reductase (NADPH)